jgi:hypothetical protein
LASAVAAAGGTQSSPAAQEQQPRQPTSIELTITGGPGAPPRYAVPDFVALSTDADTQAIAKTLGQVLWDDLAFEREFYMIPRDTYRTIPAATVTDRPPFDRWRELGADGSSRDRAEDRQRRARGDAALNVRGRQQVFSREYSGSAANPRLYAHTIADEIHQSQRGLRGVARTKLAFASDRDRERACRAPSRARGEGDLHRRLRRRQPAPGHREPLVEHHARLVARRTGADLHLVPARLPRPVDLPHLPGHAGTADRGHVRAELWLGLVARRHAHRVHVESRRQPGDLRDEPDGSNVRRLTNHPAIDITPTWSPTGTQIAFTSDRSGRRRSGRGRRRAEPAPDHLRVVRDRATWSPAPYNEIAYAARTGPGYDIKIYDLASGQTRQITFGEGTNESPSVRAERTPPGVQFHPGRPLPGLHGGPRRQERAAGHARPATTTRHDWSR